MQKSTAAIFLITLFAASLRADPPKPVDFSHDIVPIIKSRCGECHTAGKISGKLSLDTRESILRAKAAVPGKSAESEILKRITSTDPDYLMPQKGERLTA